MRVLAVVGLVCLVVLAGCSQAPASVDEAVEKECQGGFCGQDAVEGGDGRDLRTELTASDTVPAPTWEVGDVFEQHMFFGQDDREGRHIQTMVTEAGSGGYTIATSDEEAARWEAVYDYPILGTIGTGLETTAFGSDWSWMYSFPLGDGDTWSASIEEMINWNTYNFSDFELTLTSSYDAAIDTPHGDFPGFWIEGVTQDGEILARYNYVPAIGWFSHLWLYDWDTPDADDIMFHAMSMGTWTNYTGDVFVAEAETAIEDFWGVFPDPENPTGSTEGQPGPRTFQVPESDRIMGIAVPFAFPGRSEIGVTRPSGQEDAYMYQQLGAEGPGFEVFFIDQDPEAGTWDAAFYGAGVYVGGFLWLEAVSVEQTTFS